MSIRSLVVALFSLFFMNSVVAHGLWRTHVGPEGQAGNFKYGGGVDAWIPLCQGEYSLFFLQGGGGYFREAVVGTAGVGFRQLQRDRCWALGVNGFIDVAHPTQGRRGTFGQVGAGVELFSCHWIARGNLYVPFSGKHRLENTSETFLVQEGLSVFSDTFNFSNREEVLSGAEGEVGYEGELGWGRLGLYGGYSYFRRGDIKAVHGPKARAEYRIDFGCPWPNNWGELILGAEYERDRIHGQTALVRVGLRFFSFCQRCDPCCCSSIHRYMERRVWREKSPWLEQDRVVDSIERVQVADLIFANNLINGVGTQTDPATLPVGLALLNLSPNSILFLLQDTGDMTALGTITPPTGAQILGFGDESSRLVTFPGGGTLLVQDLTGAGRARVNGGVLDPIIETANSQFICGIELIDGATAIRQGPGVNGVLIEDVVITDPTTTGILSDGGVNLTIDRAQISAPGAIGVRTFGSTGTLTVTGTPTANTVIAASAAISIDTIVGSHRIDNTTGTGTVNAVIIDNGSDTRIDNSTFTATGLQPAVASLGVGPFPLVNDLRVTNSTLTGVAGGVGINNASPTGIFLVDNNIILGTGGGSIGVNVFLTFGTSDNTLVSNNTITADFRGIIHSVGLTSSTSEFSNNAITLAAGTSAISHVYGGIALGVSNGSILNNNQLAPIAASGYEATTVGTGGTCCITIAGNNRAASNATDIVVQGDAVVTLDVFDLANLSATNNGLMVTNLGFTAQAAGPCPLPVIP